MILDPAHYAQHPGEELLAAAAEGQIGIDHRLLHALLDHPERTLPGILAFAARPHDQQRLDLTEDLVFLCTHLARPEAIPFLINLIRAEPEDVSEHVVRALMHIGASALEPLLKLYDELGPRRGAEVAFALAALPVRDPRIIQLLIDRLEIDPDDAVLCLALHADPQAIPALEEFLATLDPADHASASLRHEVEATIAKLRQGETPRLEPFDIWEIYPEEALPQFEVLNPEECFALLKSPDPRWRAEAAHCFTMEQLTPRQKNRLFDMARRDPAPEVRARCWEALSGALTDSTVRNAMLACLHNTQAPLVERCGALLGLAQQQTKDPGVRKRILEFYEDPRTRAKALEAMWRSLDPSYDSYFPRHLEDEDLEVRRHAVLGVGYRSLGEHAARLIPLFRHEVLRLDALYAYALSAPVPIEEESIRDLFEQIEDLAGMNTEEAVLVQNALDDRLELAGREPIFAHESRQEDD